MPNAEPGANVYNMRRKSAKRREPSQEFYDRLSRSVKKFDPQIIDLQKEREELRHCTFKPETNFKS